MITYIMLVLSGFSIFLKIDLHELLEVTPIIILTAFFCNLKTLLTSVEEPQNIMPYVSIEWK